MIRFQIVFDGGSKGNPGPAYGSYRIRPWIDEDGTTARMNFGAGTNNEAEYLSAIAALRSLRAFLDGRGTAPEEVQLELRGDSQLVMRQLAGQWKAKDARMRNLRDEALALLEPFEKVEFVEQSRERTLEVLGH